MTEILQSARCCAEALVRSFCQLDLSWFAIRLGVGVAMSE